MPTTPATILESYQFGGRPLSVARGSPLPLGASQTPSGVNFALISRDAEVGRPRPAGRVQRGGAGRDPARPGLLPDRISLAHPGGWRARGVLLRLPGRRPEGGRRPVRPVRRPARPGLSGPLVRPALGGRGDRAEAQPDDQPADDRGRRPLAGPAPHPSLRHGPLRAARPRVHRRPVVGRPRPPGDKAPSPASSKRFLTSRPSASRPSSCCRSTSSTSSTASSSTR